MRIILLSDTHSFQLPSQLLEACKTSDAIIHAGDICDLQTLSALQALAPVYAVYGNMCELGLKKKLPEVLVVELAGKKFGICHGHLGSHRDALANVMSAFAAQELDVVVFGHSHQVCQQQIGKTLYLNPGSPNDHIKAPFCSYMVVEITGKKISVSLKKC